jgi:hypothetical protein
MHQFNKSLGQKRSPIFKLIVTFGETAFDPGQYFSPSSDSIYRGIAKVAIKYFKK